MSQNGTGKVRSDRPDTEVAPRAERRKYTSEYKQRILQELDNCRQPGEIGAILRREGLYSQIISKWRQQVRQHGSSGLEPHRRGPKASPEASELARLQQENERLRRQLDRAELIIEVQKKSLRCSMCPWTRRTGNSRTDRAGGAAGAADRRAGSLRSSGYAA